MTKILAIFLLVSWEDKAKIFKEKDRVFWENLMLITILASNSILL